MRNAQITPEHANHPGWDADGCGNRIAVRASSSGHGPGFACGLTGSHCLPTETCGRTTRDLLAHPFKTQAEAEVFDRANFVR